MISHHKERSITLWILYLIFLIYIILLFAYPYILGRNVRYINGDFPYIEKIIQNSNLIPFHYNYDININIIIENIAIKILMFFPLGMLLKKNCDFKKGFSMFMIICFSKELLHLITFVDYFDINDFILYTIGYLLGWKLTFQKID